MRLSGMDGSGLELRVTGYQFPDAPDENWRCSWHMVAGTAHAPEGEWSFHWQGLACHDSERLGPWLRRAAAGRLVPVAARDVTNYDLISADGSVFRAAEPNLVLGVVGLTPDAVELRVSLTQEFRPPWLPRPGGTHAFDLVLQRDHVITAAEDWERTVAAYPDKSVPGRLIAPSPLLPPPR